MTLKQGLPRPPTRWIETDGPLKGLPTQVFLQYMLLLDASIGSQGSFAAGSVFAPSLNWGDLATGFYRIGLNEVGFSINGVKLLDFAAGLETVAGGILSSSPSAGIGYATGAGAAVAQATNRSTGVTINAITGQITGQGTSLAATSFATFTVTNSAVSIHDAVVLSVQSGPTAGTSLFNVSAVRNGSFDITATNVSLITADTGAPILNFAIIKGVSS